MKSSKSLIITVLVLVVIAALYRIIPNRPLGFAPQLAMALFGGAVIKDKKWAFALPLFSMFLSDVLYQVLYAAGLSVMPGFYEGQLTNYILLAGITVLGFTLGKLLSARIAAGYSAMMIGAYALLAPTLFFIFSNGAYWLGGGPDVRTNLPLERSFAGLMQSYTQAIPFYRGALVSTLAFSAVLFGGYYLLTAASRKGAAARA
ncbi:MAG: hypothetical protein JST39_19225 [Bacteroidetes bacterium]|nr:hypothetical protein [Bacteroidota bacterium]